MNRATSLILLVLVLNSCIVDDESSFIKDTYDPRMPEYSEEGANTAGAYINDRPWSARKRIISSIFSSSPVTRGLMSFYSFPDSVGTFVAFEGGDFRDDLSGASCSVGIFLSEFNLNEPSDLQILANERIELDGIVNYGQLIFQHDFSAIVPENAGIGTLYIRKVAQADNGVWFISGTFGFSIDTEVQEATVFSGRFDYEVFPEQFGEI